MIIIEAEAGEGADRESRTAERMIELALRERSEGRKLGLIASSEVCGLVLEALSEEGTGAPRAGGSEAFIYMIRSPWSSWTWEGAPRKKLGPTSSLQLFVRWMRRTWTGYWLRVLTKAT